MDNECFLALKENVYQKYNSLKEYSTNFNSNELDFGMSLLNNILEPDIGDIYFKKVLSNIAKAKGLCLEYGLMNIKSLAILYSENGRYYQELNEQLDYMLNISIQNLIENYGNISLDTTMGHLSACRYLLTKHSEIAYNAVTKIVEEILSKRFEKFVKTHTDINDSEKKFYPNGYLDIGCAHGISGLLWILSDYYEIFHDEKSLKAINIVYSEILINTQIHNEVIHISGINDFKSIFEITPTKSEYYSWCYGTLGIMNALNYANSIAENVKITEIINKFKQQLLATKEIVFSNDSNCICHGYVGALLLLDNLMLGDLWRLPFIEDLLKKVGNSFKRNFNKQVADGFSHIDGFISEFMFNILFTNSEKKECFYKYFICIK